MNFIKKNKVGLAIILLAVGLVVGFGQLKANTQISGDLSEAAIFLEKVDSPEKASVAVELLNYLGKFVSQPEEEELLGSRYHKTQEDFADGLTVNGSAFVTSGRALSVASITNSGAFTQTGALTVTGATDVGIFTQGGGETSTTTGATGILSATAIDTENVVNIAPLLIATTATTLTMTPSTTFPGIPNAGDSRQIKYSNTTSTPFALTMAEGTGMDLYQGSTTTVDFKIPIGNSAIVDYYRKANSDIEAFMTVYTK